VGSGKGLFVIKNYKNKMEKERWRENMRAELLAQPVLETIISEIGKSPESVSWVGLSGSKARGAELGTVSDDDLVVLLGKNIDGDPLNMRRLDQLMEAICRATEKLIGEKGIMPVFASTIRLEDAQMALAKSANPTDFPIHMIHLLVYPSVEAAIAFEPPLLNRGLFGRSLTLLGETNAAKSVEVMARDGERAEDPNLSLGGLDGISDNFRMLLANRHILPAEFLGPQVIHVLDYTLKWIMAGEVERRFFAEPGTWFEIFEGFAKIRGGDQLIALVKRIRQERADGARDLTTVSTLCREVISLWPVLTRIRTEEI